MFGKKITFEDVERRAGERRAELTGKDPAAPFQLRQSEHLDFVDASYARKLDGPALRQTLEALETERNSGANRVRAILKIEIDRRSTALAKWTLLIGILTLMATCFSLILAWQFRPD